MSEEKEPQEWGMQLPFWIDTDAYTDRDREMFVSGFEFNMIYQSLQDGWHGTRPIHRENESRIRMLCGRLKIPCEITPHAGYDGCETWSELTVKEFSS
jgi:hypothetical protein